MRVGVRIRVCVGMGVGVCVTVGTDVRTGVWVSVCAGVGVRTRAAAVRRLSVPVGGATVVGGVVLGVLGVFRGGTVRGAQRCSAVGR